MLNERDFSLSLETTGFFYFLQDHHILVTSELQIHRTLNTRGGFQSDSMAWCYLQRATRCLGTAIAQKVTDRIQQLKINST
jgi:hypothetical protein